MSLAPNFRQLSLFKDEDVARAVRELEKNTRDAIANIMIQADAKLIPTNLKNSAYTAVLDDLVICAGTFNVALPVATGLNNGRRVGVVVKSGTVTVLTQAATCLVQGAASDALATVGLRVYMSDGVGWWRAP